MTTEPESAGETSAYAMRALEIIECMPGHAWSADPDGRFTYVSPNALEYLGAPKSDLDPFPEEDEFGWRRVVHPDDYDRIAARWRHCLKTGDHYDTEHRIRGADGAYRWFRNFGRASRDDEGHIVQWYGTTIDIDEQKRAEAMLCERERELSQLVDMIPSHVWRLTADGEPTFFNKRMADYLGMEAAETVEANLGGLDGIIETVHPDDAAAFRTALNRSLATGETFSMRYRLRRADGVYHWMSSRAEPLRDESGRIVQWYGLCHDIDDQVKAEEAVRQSEQELRQMIDAVPVRIWSTTPSGGPMYFNKQYQDFFRSIIDGFDAQGELRIDSLMQELIHPEDVPAVRRALDNCFETGDKAVLRFRWREKGEAYRWAEWRVAPRRDDDGAIAQWYGVSIDVNDEVRANEALRERERELSLLIEMVPAFIGRMEPDGRPTFLSKRTADYIGLEHIGAWDKPGMDRLATMVGEAIHPDDAPTVARKLGHSLATGERYTMKFRLRRADGVYRWYEGRADALRDADGEIVQWYTASVDIDNEVRAQDALRAAQESLARATQAASLAELSASIAHEVNQPLAAIAANAHACQRWMTANPPNLERALTTVGRIIRDANAAADVVSRIRALFKQSTEERNNATIDVVIADAKGLMRDAADRRRVRIEIEVENDLPLVTIDRIQIQQVLVNLMRNGIEAMDAASGERILGIIARRAGNVIQIKVSDRGGGIKFPERIFEPFYTTKESGMGMGLAICRSIIESHGGRLWAEGNDPHGASLIFTLPIELKEGP